MIIPPSVVELNCQGNRPPANKVMNMASLIWVEKKATCKRCGCKDVAWQQGASGKWYLVNARTTVQGIYVDRGDFHKCQPILTPAEREAVDFYNRVAERHEERETTDHATWMSHVLASDGEWEWYEARLRDRAPRRIKDIYQRIEKGMASASLKAEYKAWLDQVYSQPASL